MKQVLFVVVLLSGSTMATATADGPDFWRVRQLKDGDDLNIRERPTVVAPIVVKAPSGARGLKNLGCRQIRRGANAVAKGLTRWCKVEYGGKTGWAAQAFLEEDSEPVPAGAETGTGAAVVPAAPAPQTP